MKPLFRVTLFLCLLILQTSNVYSQGDIYFPSGIKWGAFTISPLVENENEYDSNLFKTDKKADEDIKDDFILHIKPSINIRSNWSRHAVDLTVRGDIGLHQNYEQEDFENIFIDLSGRIDVLRDSYATTKFYWSQRNQERGEIDNGGINGSNDFTTIGGYFEYEHLFNRLRVNVSNDANYLEFEGISTLDGTQSSDSLRNRFANTSSAQLSYIVNPRLDAFVRGTYNFTNYDADEDRNRSVTVNGVTTDIQGFNRDSDGFEILGGVAFDFTGKLFGDVFFGYREQYYADSRFKTTSGITGGAKLKWLATPLTTVSLAVDNDLIQTTQIGASSGISTAFKLNVDHELLRYVLLNAHGGYTLNEYEGGASALGIQGISSREDETIVLGIKAKYLYSRNFYLKGEYFYRQRESNVPLNDYSAHRVLFSIGLQL